ncbi:MAG: T9SS type A sorting domain-containing protein [Bacteroidota bacterium]
MKSKKFTSLCLIALFACSFFQNGFAQFCVNRPNDLAGIEACNRFIATQFSPRIHQWSNVLSGNNPDANYDRIVKVDFDGDWIATNNWEEMDNISQHDITPHIYYNVLWTEEMWIILYTYYFARDWANGGFECDEDEHEGDLAKVLVVARRATDSNDNAEDLLLGFATTKDNQDCITEGTNAFAVGDRIQPFISSAAGSHHSYTANDHKGIVDYDGSSNPCKLFGDDLIIYGFGDPPTSNPTPLVGDCLGLLVATLEIFPLDILNGNENYRDKMIDCEVNNPPAPNTESYDLIDMFDANEGLWEQRTNTDLFTSGDLLNQRMLCNNGDGCGDAGILWTIATEDKSPWAPWTGNMGANPLQYVHDEFDNSFCNYTVTDCQYEYNPYLCEFYDIETPDNFDYNGTWVESPHDNGPDVVAAFTLSAFDGYTGLPSNVAWTITVPPGKNFTCSGCQSQPADRITVTILNTEYDEILANPSGYTISATADYLECGTITKTKEMSVAIREFISTGNDCEKMVIEVKDEYHLDGNQYSWSFPLYDALSTISSNGRRVEFNTETVIQQTSTATNPQNKLDYQLTVTNISYVNTVQLDGSLDIPDCQYDPRELALIVYPNPATDNIFLEVEGVQPDEPLDIQIFDHQFNLISRDLYIFKEQGIDLSRLENGLYFVSAVTKEGRKLTSKFCVGRH